MFPSRSTMPAPYDQRIHSASFWRCARGPSPTHINTQHVYNPAWHKLLNDITVSWCWLLFNIAGISCVHRFSSPTIVEVAEVACVEKEMCSEKVSEAALAWSEGQRSVEVKTTCPVRLSTQIVTWNTHIIRLRQAALLHRLIRHKHICSIQ